MSTNISGDVGHRPRKTSTLNVDTFLPVPKETKTDGDGILHMSEVRDIPVPSVVFVFNKVHDAQISRREHANKLQAQAEAAEQIDTPQKSKLRKNISDRRRNSYLEYYGTQPTKHKVEIENADEPFPPGRVLGEFLVNKQHSFSEKQIPDHSNFISEELSEQVIPEPIFFGVDEIENHGPEQTGDPLVHAATPISLLSKKAHNRKPKIKSRCFRSVSSPSQYCSGCLTGELLAELPSQLIAHTRAIDKFLDNFVWCSGVKY